MAPLAGERAEASWPLALVFCHNCALVQAGASLPPDLVLRSSPPGLAGQAPARVRAAEARAAELVERCGLGWGSLVVGIGSNDGTMLAPFAARGIEVLGVDPAPLAAQRAAEAGIPTLRAFFGETLAETLARRGDVADLVLAGGALRRAGDLADLVGGIARLLKPEGVVALEFYSIVDIESGGTARIRHDTVFHLSLTALARDLDAHGLHLNDAARSGAAGRIAAIAGHATRRSARLDELLEEERALGVADASLYRRLLASEPEPVEEPVIRRRTPVSAAAAIAAGRRARRAAVAAR